MTPDPVDLDAMELRLDHMGYAPWKDDVYAVIIEVRRLRAAVSAYEGIEALAVERKIRLDAVRALATSTWIADGIPPQLRVVEWSSVVNALDG